MALIVVAILWTTRPDVWHERIVPTCEVCGQQATTALPDADGKFHAYCERHDQEAR